MQILAHLDPVVEATSITWQQHLKHAIRDVNTLLIRVGLPPVASVVESQHSFPVFAPLPYVARIEHGNPLDPLLLQVLPVGDEFRVVDGFVSDPIGERSLIRGSGIIQKYAGRVLMIASGACAIHCRYCFRREFPYEVATAAPANWDASLESIRRDESIDEVILSGGDPLVLVDESLRDLIERIRVIPHIRRLRIHTRLPIVIPRRVTPELVGILGDFAKPVAFVVHSNHARELDDSVREAMSKMRLAANVTLLNQSVLLRGVNDDAQVLIDLSNRLSECGIVPYYLHQLDRVSGAAHFEVDIARGQALIDQLRRRLPGYLVPRYVQEIADQPYKTPL